MKKEGRAFDKCDLIKMFDIKLQRIIMRGTEERDKWDQENGTDENRDMFFHYRIKYRFYIECFLDLDLITLREYEAYQNKWNSNVENNRYSDIVLSSPTEKDCTEESWETEDEDTLNEFSDEPIEQDFDEEYEEEE